ncbi:MAG: peptide deformylase [Bacteroidales bacterium]|nr:peptide deformylase [Bacteroidales bacterium]
MKKFLIFLSLVLLLSSCNLWDEYIVREADWDSYELFLIGKDKPVMKVLTVENAVDEEDLRTPSAKLNRADICSDEYAVLVGKMIATVKAEDGVGLAAPQVDIRRRMVAVQRMDKFGGPFEIYPNIRIVKTYGDPVCGPEGCLSVPGKHGDVPRYQDIKIRYTSPRTLRDTSERVLGYVAVIFQHECGHLDGIIYTDKAVSVTDDE